MAKRKAKRSPARRQKSAKPPSRPMGVTIICLLNWFMSLIGVLGGLALFAAGTVLGLIPIPFLGVLGAFGSLFGIVIFLIGIISAVITYWLWNMERRGYQWVMVFTGISALLSLVSFNLVGLVINGVILWYLWKNKKIFE